MYFKFKCDHCGNDLKIGEEKAGLKARCPYCNGTVVVPAPPWSDEEAAESPPTQEAPPPEPSRAAAGDAKRPPRRSARSEEPRRPTRPRKPPRPERRAAASEPTPLTSGTDVPMLHSIGIGVGLTVVFYILLLPFSRTYFGKLFLDRGWVPFVEVTLMGWAVAILFLKSRKLRHQKAAMLLDALPSSLGEEISPATVDRFVEYLRCVPSHLRDSIMVNRIRRALEHFRVRRSNPEVATMLATQSEIDASSVQSSYTMIRVLIWAIPILGFIGTVLGISDAVGGFSESLDKAQDIEVLKASLNEVTGGLAVAFDTTLVALCMSVLASFPAHSMQKAEENLLNWVDEYCGENLLKRLDDAATVTDAASGTQAVLNSIGAAIARIEQESSQRLRSVGADMTRLHDEQLKRLGEVTRSIDEQSRAVEKRAAGHQAKVEKAIAQMVDQVGKAMAQMGKHLAHTAAGETQRLEADARSHREAVEKALQGIASPVRDAMHEVVEHSATIQKENAATIEAHVAALRDGIASLNTALRELDGKQVVIQRPPRRWWPFGGSSSSNEDASRG